MKNFKVWCKNYNEWEKDPCLIGQDGEVYQLKRGMLMRYNKENHVVCFGTGLHDKNGREIYEGDYLRCKKYIGGNFVEYHYELGYVEFVYGAFGLHRKQGFYRPFKDWLEDYELEIIGNIYENPELLEVE